MLAPFSADAPRLRNYPDTTTCLITANEETNLEVFDMDNALRISGDRDADEKIGSC